MTVDTDMLQERLDVLREKYGVPGASLAVLSPGSTTAVASGVLNLATGVPATPDSLFQIGSISKVWTATVVMQLVDEGLVGLDEPVQRYLPAFRVSDPDVSATVTIRHLLAHNSGIDGDHLEDTGRGDDVLEKYVTSCADLRQVHPIGAAMSYCNTGYSILGRVIEVVTGTLWDDAMRTRLFAPLGLTHTVTLPEEALRYRTAIGHIQLPGQDLMPSPAWGLPRSLGPAGTICATATDLLAFAAAHLADGATAGGDRVLSVGSAEAMRQPQVAVPSGGYELFPDQWCLGWSAFSWNGRSVVGHDGQTIGQSAFLRLVPDCGVAIALLTNGGDPMGLFLDLSRDLLAEFADVEMPPPATPLDPAPQFDPAPYLGVYSREGARLEVVARAGEILGIQTITGPAAAMMPDPLELPLRPLDLATETFLTRVPLAPDVWLPARFVTLSDGSRCIHIAGRATPKVA